MQTTPRTGEPVEITSERMWLGAGYGLAFGVGVERPTLTWQAGEPPLPLALLPDAARTDPDARAAMMDAILAAYAQDTGAGGLERFLDDLAAGPPIDQEEGR